MFKQCIYGVFMNFYFLFPDSGCLNKTEILYVSMSCTTHISNSHALILCKNMKPDLQVSCLLQFDLHTSSICSKIKMNNIQL